MTKYRIIPLDKKTIPNYKQVMHSFDCGHDALNKYLKNQASQEIKRRVASCFVMLDGARILGYYTLSAGSVPLTDLPASQQKDLPRYHFIPVVRLGRFAISKDHQGCGLGAILLYDALHRSSLSEIAAYAMLVDAKDHNVAQFYAHYGFIPFIQQPLSLFLPLNTVRALLA